MGQSTNDTIPSATHLAIVPRIDALIGELRTLAKAFEKKSAEFADVVKVGRTCWQDALPLTVGQEFSATPLSSTVSSRSSSACARTALKS